MATNELEQRIGDLESNHNTLAQMYFDLRDAHEALCDAVREMVSDGARPSKMSWLIDKIDQARIPRDEGQWKEMSVQVERVNDMFSALHSDDGTDSNGSVGVDAKLSALRDNLNEVAWSYNLIEDDAEYLIDDTSDYVRPILEEYEARIERLTYEKLCIQQECDYNNIERSKTQRDVWFEMQQRAETAEAERDKLQAQVDAMRECGAVLREFSVNRVITVEWQERREQALAKLDALESEGE